MRRKTLLLEEMRWPEVKEALEEGYRTVVLAAASIEQHGPALPENTDTLLGYRMALMLAEDLGNALVAPVIRPGLSAHHLALPGSLTLRPETFHALVEDYVSSYIHHGFDTVVLLSAHGGNFKALATLAQELDAAYPNATVVYGMEIEDTTAMLDEFERQEGLEHGVCGGHACCFEASAMLVLAPELVRMDKAERGFVGDVPGEVLERFFTQGVCAVSPIGVMGDTTCATPELGEKILKMMRERQAAVVRRKLAEKKK